MTSTDPHAGPATDVATLPIADLEPGASPLSEGERPRLVGSRCEQCGTTAFPRRHVCTGCGGTALADAELADTGTLYSYATVHVSSSRPTPYTLGYVDLADGVRVLSQVLTDPASLHPDQPVRLQVDGDTWSFEPSSAATTEES